MNNQIHSFENSIKKMYENDILSVYSINDIPTIEPHILDVVNDTARGKGSLDNTELVSYAHCDNNIKTDKKTYLSERDYEKWYNQVIGPLTSDKSIPDGTIIADDVIHLLSVFRISNNIIEKYICRKIQKFRQLEKSKIGHFSFKEFDF